jgi:hypothetical protein
MATSLPRSEARRVRPIVLLVKACRRLIAGVVDSPEDRSKKRDYQQYEDKDFVAYVERELLRIIGHAEAPTLLAAIR